MKAFINNKEISLSDLSYNDGLNFNRFFDSNVLSYSLIVTKNTFIKSLEKELQKQKTIVKEIKNAIQMNMRKPKGTATESAINRLIGMSVGRIGLDNFEEVSTDLCWKNGFKELTINEHSTRQIKQLDRNRNKLYYKLLKEIEEPEIELKKVENRQLIKYDKPFSYYYQILERERKVND